MKFCLPNLSENTALCSFKDLLVSRVLEKCDLVGGGEELPQTVEGDGGDHHGQVRDDAGLPVPVNQGATVQHRDEDDSEIK